MDYSKIKRLKVPVEITHEDLNKMSALVICMREAAERCSNQGTAAMCGGDEDSALILQGRAEAYDHCRQQIEAVLFKIAEGAVIRLRENN